MDAPNGDSGKDDSVKDLGAEATCAPGCGCSAGGSGERARWITGIVILGVAGGLVARAMIKDNGAKSQEDEATFAVVASPTDASPLSGPSEPGAEGSQDEVVATVAGKELATLADLNKLAAETDGVFVYLPGRDTGTTNDAPTDQLEAAVKTIKAQGVTVGIFTLKTDAPEYIRLASQMAVPGVIALAKGRGMAPVKGAITENSLIQSFVAASNAGGCGPASAGCGPSGCK